MDVLIVERDELFAEVLSDALSADGISVAIVPNEEEAMRACRDGSPRVVITGINRRSEDMKGLYFARAMREHGAPCTRTEHVQATVQRRAEKAATRQQSAGTVRQENRRSEGPSGHDAAPD
jgi:DNA-binding response OmpR family regulator